MLRTNIIILISLILGAVSASATSAVRRPDESWQSARIRAEFLNAFTLAPLTRGSSAEDAAVSLNEINVNEMSEFGKSDAQVQALFEDIRNMRYLEDPAVKNFKRRISWLYPMDGCFARAEQVSHLLRKNDAKADFHRVFIFGDLSVRTRNSASGLVSWWYHVAVLIRLQNKAFVIDPSLEVKRPIELSDWVKLMTPDPNQVQLAVCSSHSYVPSSECNAQTDLTDAKAYNQIAPYLTNERHNLTRLGRDPEVELGNSPPW